jgi:uncharacterized protein DUF2442
MGEDKRDLVRVASVNAIGEYTLHIRWVNGEDHSVDLRATVRRFKGLRALRDPPMFARATASQGGHSVVWPGDLDIGADRLLELAREQGT